MLTTSGKPGNKTYSDAVGALNKGYDRLTEAAVNVRQRYSPPVPDEAELMRYKVLAKDPGSLAQFVSKGLGTKDPDRIQAGMNEYLSAMRAKFGAAE